MGRIPKSNAVQLFGMIITSLIIQVISLAKSSIIASNFGAGVELDAFHFSNSIAAFITTFVAGGVTTVVLPEYVRRGKRESIDSFLTCVFSVVAILFLSLFLFRNPIVNFITGKGDEFLTYSDSLMGWAMIAQSITAVLSVTAAHYQAKNNFITPKIITLCVNALSLIVMVCMKSLTIYQYVHLICITGVVQLLVDLAIAIRQGFRFSLRFNWLSQDTVRLLKIFVPILISTGVYKIHGLVDTAITSSLAAGSLTILSYSNHIVTAVNSLIIGNLLLFAYPRIVQATSQSVGVGIGVTRKYSTIFHWIVGGLIVVFFAIGEDSIGLLFGHGRFNSDAVRRTFLCTFIYLFGQQFNIVRDLVYRFCYAEKDTATTLRNSIKISILNILLSLLFVQIWDMFGVVLGTVVSSCWSLVSISRIIKSKYDEKHQMRAMRFDFLKTALSVTISCVVIWGVKSSIDFVGVWYSLLFYGIMGTMFFSLITFLLHYSTMKRIMLEYRKKSDVGE